MNPDMCLFFFFKYATSPGHMTSKKDIDMAIPEPLGVQLFIRVWGPDHNITPATPKSSVTSSVLYALTPHFHRSYKVVILTTAILARFRLSSARVVNSLVISFIYGLLICSGQYYFISLFDGCFMLYSSSYPRARPKLNKLEFMIKYSFFLKFSWCYLQLWHKRKLRIFC